MTFAVLADHAEIAFDLSLEFPRRRVAVVPVHNVMFHIGFRFR